MDPNAKKTTLRMIPYGLYVLTAASKDGQVAAATVNWVVNRLGRHRELFRRMGKSPHDDVRGCRGSARLLRFRAAPPVDPRHDGCHLSAA